MAAKVAYTINTSEREAVKEIASELKPFAPVMVLYFVSSKYDQNSVAEEMKRSFPEATVAGCSTAGEIVTGRMLQNSLVAMAIGPEIIAECSLQPLYNISSENHVPYAFKQFEKYHSISMSDKNIDSFVGIILCDGLRMAEERVMETIGRLTSIPVVGASAGDDLKFEKTFVHFDGRACSDVALLILVRPERGFSILKTQSFLPTATVLTATSVDEATRTVHEFDHQPATVAYAKALGVPEGELVEYFMSNPLGLMVQWDPFVRSPQQIKEKSVVFYCAVSEGMELQVLKATDIVTDTGEALNKAVEEFGVPAALVNFNCILRTLELDEKGKTDEYGRLFTGYPTIGFSTYGEEYIKHINQTATMLLLK